MLRVLVITMMEMILVVVRVVVMIANRFDKNIWLPPKNKNIHRVYGSIFRCITHTKHKQQDEMRTNEKKP